MSAHMYVCIFLTPKQIAVSSLNIMLSNIAEMLCVIEHSCPGYTESPHYAKPTSLGQSPLLQGCLSILARYNASFKHALVNTQYLSLQRSGPRYFCTALMRGQTSKHNSVSRLSNLFISTIFDQVPYTYYLNVMSNNIFLQYCFLINYYSSLQIIHQPSTIYKTGQNSNCSEIQYQCCVSIPICILYNILYQSCASIQQQKM